MAGPLAPSYCRESAHARGSPWANRLGKAAIATRMTTSTAAAQKILLRLRSRQASPARLRGLSCLTGAEGPDWSPPPVAMVTAFGSLIADPRVQGGVQKVDDQAHQQEDDHQEADEAHDERAVL